VSPPTRVAPPRPTPARPARSSRRRLVLGIVAAFVVAIGAAVYVVGFTGVLGVRHVTVTGVRALSADEVRAAAGVPDGQPLARVDTVAVADHVRALPGVERVAVARSWPRTLRITITERHGVAVVKRAGAYWLVDPDGVVFQRVAARPNASVTAIDPAIKAALLRCFTDPGIRGNKQAFAACATASGR